MKKESTLDHVFLVEDNEMFARTLSMALENTGKYTVSIFHTGESMFEKMKETPSVIILDFNLDSDVPGAADGSEVLKMIRQKDPSIPVIMLTSQQDIMQAVNLLKKGATDYILKNDSFFDKLMVSLNQIMEIRMLKNELQSIRKSNALYRKRFSMVTISLSLALIALWEIFIRH